LRDISCNGLSLTPGTELYTAQRFELSPTVFPWKSFFLDFSLPIENFIYDSCDKQAISFFSGLEKVNQENHAMFVFSENYTGVVRAGTVLQMFFFPPLKKDRNNTRAVGAIYKTL